MLISFGKDVHISMKIYIFSSLMNLVAAIVLFGEGATKMNNLDTSIPAILCLTAFVLSVIQIVKKDLPL